MELNDAINHLKESLADPTHKWGCEECKKEHEELLEWLEDYKQLKSDYDDLDNRLRTANTEIDRLQSAISWIPCGERLPEAREIVLVYTHRRGFTLDFLDVYVSNGKRFFHNSDVTHWMPLPLPPNKRGDAQ